MSPGKARRGISWAAAMLLAAAPVAFAQNPTPSPASAPPAPAASPSPSPTPSPVSGIRNKLAAGDLLSAESMLEVHRAENGEDDPYLSGLAWLARGALLVGDLDKAKRYAADVRARCADRMAHGADLQADHVLEIALGAAIEVEAQRIERTSGPRKAAEYVRRELAGITGPAALRSRLNKRIDILTLTGSAAPELAIEDFIGDRPPTLASLKGKPIMLFLWAEWCGDCKAQQGALARARKRHAAEGIQFVALTRYYDEEANRAAEKARVESVWKTAYADVGSIPIVISTASMERYGGSSTPTFVFVDRAGVVREYTPTRLTDAELDRALAKITR
jgi:cytochrome c biogenesis protein CcmG, thiol:disulfide interchange protein DsbE